MWEPIETLVNAQSAVSRKLAAHWRGFVHAAAVPAIAAVGVLVWMAQAYWASTAFAAGQAGALIAAGALVVFLSSLAVGRMIRIGLRLDSAPAGFRGLRTEASDMRTLAVCLGLVALIGLSSGLRAGMTKLVMLSFVAPGSAVIARPVLATADALIWLGLYYLLGRLALFLPGRAALPGGDLRLIWRASEGHGAILFIVAIAVPCAAAGLLVGPALWWVDAIPWPAPDDFARTESLALAVLERLWLLAPLLFLGLLAGWSLLAASLCAAWEALDERGVFEAARVPG